LPEEIELLRSELDLAAVDLHLATAGIDMDVAMLNRLRLSLLTFGRRAAQDRLDARDELARVERLRHVVVGADLEADDLVDVLVPRGQHQDRDIRLLTDAAADLDPVDVREHEIEDDQRGLLALDSGQRVRAVPDGGDVVARV